MDPKITVQISATGFTHTRVTSIQGVKENTTQVTTVISGIARGCMDEMGALVVQTQKLVISQHVIPAPSNMESRLWKIFLAKIQEEFQNFKEDPQGFKNLLDIHLNSFLKKLQERESKNTSHLVEFLNDLKNKSLEEIDNKYFNKESLFVKKFPFLEDLSVLFKSNCDSFSMSNLFLRERERLRNFISQDCLTQQPLNRDPLMRLLAAKKMEKHPALNVYVVDLLEVKFILNYLAQAKLAGVSLRCQFLIRSEVHYTAVDIKIEKGKMQAAIMDAGGDKKKFKVIVQKFQNIEAEEIFILGALDRIQSDPYNCGFFSLDTLIQSSKNPQFFEFLKSLPYVEKNGCKRLSWDSLPASYVKFANSINFLKRYLSKHPALEQTEYKKGKTFGEYIRTHFESRMIKGESKETNVAIERKIHRYSQISQQALASLHDEQLASLVSSWAVMHFIRKHPIPN